MIIHLARTATETAVATHQDETTAAATLQDERAAGMQDETAATHQDGTVATATAQQRDGKTTTGGPVAPLRGADNIHPHLTATLQVGSIKQTTEGVATTETTPAATTPHAMTTPPTECTPLTR